jgi:hypothetical protein
MVANGARAGRVGTRFSPLSLEQAEVDTAQRLRNPDPLAPSPSSTVVPGATEKRPAEPSLATPTVEQRM